MKRPRWETKTKKTLVSVLLTGICLLGIQPQTAYAVVEPDYTQEITPEMQAEGITGFSQEDGEEGTTSRIAITDRVMYDSSQMMYVYSVDGGEIYANVLDGMMTANAVQITSEDQVGYTLYQESVVYENPNEDGLITEPGSYSVMIGQKGAQTRLFSFRIIGAYINEPESYELPDTCVATAETLDGEAVLTNNRVISLSEEGHYTISYQCVRNGLEYELEFTVDKTAPRLTFDGVKKGKARGKVTIEGLEDDDSLSITMNGTEISSRTELTQPGEYTVKVTDAAGNSRLYSFYILFYLNTGGISFGLILLAAILAVGIYLYVSRKRLRVR